MKADIHKEVSISFLEAAFQLRCEARAYLYAIDELDLHEAVDVLQADAVEWGLVDALGQDRVQALMADAFRQVRKSEPPDRLSVESPASPSISNSTIEALMLCLRNHGSACLNEPKNQKRLASCDDISIRQIAARLLDLAARSNSRFHSWTKEQIVALVDEWRRAVK